MKPWERARALGGGEPRALSGGDTSRVFRVGDRVVKVLPNAPAGFFAAEARGLQRLASAGAPVPEVYEVHDDALVIEHLPPGPPAWGALGAVLARLHQTAAPAYGSETPVFLGRFGFRAATSDDAVTVLVEHRLRPLLDAATLGASRAGRVRTYLDRLCTRPPVTEGPCEVHGDLWSGNVLHAASGPALIDPSAQGAERAYDLSMMRLFGGFPRAFWDAYEADYPIPPEVDAGLDAHQLVFVLVHVVMFGASYHDAVDRIVG